MSTHLVAALCGAALGGAIGIFGSYFVTTRIDKRRDRALAARNLRATIIPTLNALRYTIEPGSEDFYKVLAAAFNNQAFAVTEFKKYLPRPDLVRFDTAWRAYCGDIKGDPETIFFHRYACAGQSYEFDVKVYDETHESLFKKATERLDAVFRLSE